MKRISLVVLFSLFASLLLAQTIELSESELKNQLDSVLREGNLLYRYEKSTWLSTDLAHANPVIKSEMYSYITYEEEGEIRTVILDKTPVCIAEYAFENDFDKPKYAKTEKRELSGKEKALIGIRDKLLQNISNRKYEVIVPEGYNLNFILLPHADKYKFYVITGTSQDNVIPFGNDYIFFADKNGEIENWHKFHSRLIPGYIMEEGKKVAEVIHSHLKTTPLITATDICTFMLYAPFYDIDTFSVISPAIGKYMKYSLKDNKITVE